MGPATINTITPGPHNMTFAQWLNAKGHGLFSFARERSCPFPGTPGDLAKFDQSERPRISTQAAFEEMTAAYRPKDVSVDDYLAQITTKPRDAGGTPTSDHEVRAFLATHFRQQGIPTSPPEVQVFRTGTIGLFMALLNAVSEHTQRQSLVLPTGYDHMLPPLHTAAITVLPDIKEKVLNDWLDENSSNDHVVLIFLPLVDRFSGRTLSRTRSQGIARAVLRHNRDHPYNPAYVFADDSVIDAYRHPHSIGALTGQDLDDLSLGPMGHWTLSVVTPATMFSSVNPHISFAVTRNTWLRTALNHWAGLYTFFTPHPVDELIAAANLCLTPYHRLEYARWHAMQNLELLHQALARINGITASTHTTGGGHAALFIDAALLHSQLLTNLNHVAALLHDPSCHHPTVSPDDVACWTRPPDPRQPLMLRVNLDITDAEFTRLLAAIEDLATRLHAATPHITRPPTNTIRHRHANAPTA